MSDSAIQPPITEKLRQEAAKNPGKWVYAIDPEYSNDSGVPPTGIIGAWQVTDDGSIIPEFTANPRYVASPTARGWRKAQSHLERSVQLTAVGLVSDDVLVSEFSASEVWVYSNATGGLFVAPADDGTPTVYAFTDEQLAISSGWSENVGIRGFELCSAVSPTAQVVLNAGTDAFAVMSPDIVASLSRSAQ